MEIVTLKSRAAEGYRAAANDAIIKRISGRAGEDVVKRLVARLVG